MADAGNIRKNIPHICGIGGIYAPHILPNSAYFPANFASKSPAYFKKILRHNPASLIIALKQTAAYKLGTGAKTQHNRKTGFPAKK